MHPEDRPRVMEAFDRAVKRGHLFRQAYRLLGADGAVLHVTDCGAVLPDPSGQPRLMIGVVTDVTRGRQGNNERLAFVFDRQRLRPSPAFSDAGAARRGVTKGESAGRSGGGLSRIARHAREPIERAARTPAGLAGGG